MIASSGNNREAEEDRYADPALPETKPVAGILRPASPLTKMTLDLRRSAVVITRP